MLSILDKQLLKKLSLEPKLTTSALAASLSTSQPVIWRRIKRLESLGVIKGKRLLLNQEMLMTIRILSVVVCVRRPEGVLCNGGLKAMELVFSAYDTDRTGNLDEAEFAKVPTEEGCLTDVLKQDGMCALINGVRSSQLLPEVVLSTVHVEN